MGLDPRGRFLVLSAAVWITQSHEEALYDDAKVSGSLQDVAASA